MSLAEIKTAVLSLNEAEQKQLVLELLQAIWPNISSDDASLTIIKKLIDEESVKIYQQEHMDHI